MTYLLFDVVFLVLPAVSLLASARDRLREPRAWWALVGMMVLAVAYTGPWDSYLVRTGVWDYGADRVQWTIAAVPVEEYAFMLLQVLLTGSFLLRIERRLPGSAVAPTRRTRICANGHSGVSECGLVDHPDAPCDPPARFLPRGPARQNHPGFS